MNRNLLLLSCVAVLAFGSTACQQLKARDNLNKGVQAYKSARYPEAVAFFQKAVELDPSFKTTHLYLATAYMSQYIPGAESPENVTPDAVVRTPAEGSPPLRSCSQRTLPVW